jgi:hypothetical protein
MSEPLPLSPGPQLHWFREGDRVLFHGAGKPIPALVTIDTESDEDGQVLTIRVNERCTLAVKARALTVDPAELPVRCGNHLTSGERHTLACWIDATDPAYWYAAAQRDPSTPGPLLAAMRALLPLL